MTLTLLTLSDSFSNTIDSLHSCMWTTTTTRVTNDNSVKEIVSAYKESVKIDNSAKTNVGQELGLSYTIISFLTILNVSLDSYRHFASDLHIVMHHWHKGAHHNIILKHEYFVIFIIKKEGNNYNKLTCCRVQFMFEIKFKIIQHFTISMKFNCLADINISREV